MGDPVDNHDLRLRHQQEALTLSGRSLVTAVPDGCDTPPLVDIQGHSFCSKPVFSGSQNVVFVYAAPVSTVKLPCPLW